MLVTDVLYNAADNVLIAGTFGRGAWSISNPTANLDGRSGAANQRQRECRHGPAGAAIRTIPSLLNIFENNNSSTPTRQVQLSLLKRIDVNGQGGTDTLTVDTTNGVIEVPLGIHSDGGTENDTLVVSGPAFTWHVTAPTGSRRRF